MLNSKQVRRPVVFGAIVLSTIGAAAQEPATSADRFRPAVSFDGIFGDRYGIEGNDYSVSAFLPWHIDPDRHIVFSVLRGTANDDRQVVANFGLGHRVYVDPLDSILGSSLWFDLDNTRSRIYQRGGGQLEFFCKFMEFRAGADLVFQANKTTLVAPPSSDISPFFVGNNIALGFFLAEVPYDQGYLEVGGPLPWLGRFGLGAYGGAYFLWADDADQTVGWQARVLAELTRDLQIGARYTHDATFGSNASVNIGSGKGVRNRFSGCQVVFTTRQEKVSATVLICVNS